MKKRLLILLLSAAAALAALVLLAFYMKKATDAFAAKEVCVNHPHAARAVVDAVCGGLRVSRFLVSGF